jgi:hypothetical protein
MENIEKKIKIATLYRYYLYAVVMRDNLKNENLEDFIKKLKDDISSVILIFSSPVGIYMTYFYSAIYLVIEGWRDLKLSDDKINRLIDSPYTDKLRLFRNATFHYQKEPISPKLLQFLGTEEEATEIWINELYIEFGKYFKQNSFNMPDELLEELKGKGSQEMAILIQKYFMEK